MTVEEIKSEYSMQDILKNYGLQTNRSGFISCPFHKGDREPSLKIYEKDFHCHSCGAHGDLFTFVQMMEDVSFKEAFQILGGTYEKPSFSSKLAIYRSQKQKEMKQKKRERLKEKRELVSMLVAVYRGFMRKFEPFSNEWCACYNKMQYQLYLWEELGKEEMR